MSWKFNQSLGPILKAKGLEILGIGHKSGLFQAKIGDRLFHAFLEGVMRQSILKGTINQLFTISSIKDTLLYYIRLWKSYLHIP